MVTTGTFIVPIMRLFLCCCSAEVLVYVIIVSLTMSHVIMRMLLDQLNFHTLSVMRRHLDRL